MNQSSPLRTRLQQLGRLFDINALRHLLQQGFFHLLSANFLIQFLGFGTILLIPRFVTPAELGQIKIFQDYSSLFLILASFGLNNAILKLCSEVRPDEEKAWYLKAALVRMLISAAISYAIVTALGFMGWIVDTPHLAFWLAIYMLTLPFSSGILLLSAWLQAQKRIKEMASAQFRVKLQQVPIIIIATWQFGFEGFIVGTVIAFALGLWPFLRAIGTDFLQAPRLPIPRLFHEMAGFSVLSNGVNTIGKHADIYIMSLFAQDPAEVGYYALAKILLSAASVFTSTMQRLVMPVLSEGAEDEGWFRRHVLRSQLQTAGMGLLVAGLVFGGGWIVINLFYDAAYLASLTFLGILMGRYVIWSAYAIVGISFMSLGAPRANFVVVCFTTPFSLIFTYFMLQAYGTIGVAWAQVITYAFMFLFHLIAYRIVLSRHYKRPEG